MPKTVDPMAEDPCTCDDPRELVSRTKDLSDHLSWRIIARDNQAYILEQQDDLKRTAAEVRAESRADGAKPVPQSAHEAKAAMGRILGRCENSIAGLLNSSEPASGGVASQLAHAAANLARTMAELERAEPAAEAVEAAAGAR
jgi:hypothetical protein